MVRWMGSFVLAGALAAALVGCGGAKDSDTVAAPPLITTSTVPQADTTIPVADMYAEMNDEIERACTAAIVSGNPPKPVFNEARWGTVSSAKKLMRSTKACVESRKDAAAATTTTVAD